MEYKQLKMGLISCCVRYNNSDFVLFVHRLGRIQGHLWMASYWRGHVWLGVDFNFLRDSAQNKLQFSSVLLYNKKVLLFYFHSISRHKYSATTLCSSDILCCYTLYFWTLNYTLKLHIVFEEVLVVSGVTGNIICATLLCITSVEHWSCNGSVDAGIMGWSWCGLAGTSWGSCCALSRRK
jgi:hypothetical protein